MTPSISIVTPCMNAASTIEDCVASTAIADRTRVEHIVVDGGSTDDSLKILDDFSHVRVITGTDEGPYDAVNIGLGGARGEVLAWLNADDFYLPGAVDIVLEAFQNFPAVQWLTSSFPAFADARGRIVGATREAAYDRRRALRPESIRQSSAVHAAMQQESTFWRRALWEKSGARLDPQYVYAADFELWLRFWQHAEVFALDAPLGCFRWSGQQRSRVFDGPYRAEVAAALLAHGGGEIGAFARLARRAGLLFRGLPQGMLKHFPGRSAQQFLRFDRATQAWRCDTRYAMLP